MAEYGTVKGSEVKKNLEGEKNSRILQVQLTDDQDIQSVELYRMPGEDYNPSDETRVIVITVGTSKVAIAAADVPASNDLEKGEREVYSDDGTNRLATIRLNAAGEVIFNNGSRDTARKDDAIKSTAIEDTIFWTWLAAAGTALANLGVLPPIPTTLAGKITEGTDEVKVP